MSVNKAMIEKYLEGFRRGDHSSILECLAEDVTWEMPGVYLREGRAAFDTEIENEGFVGRPEISVARMLEADDVVVVEGAVHHDRAEGEPLEARFCDVFELESGKIKRLTSYLMMIPSLSSATDQR